MFCVGVYVYLCTLMCLVAQLCLTLCDPIDCSLPGSSAHGILQARILEWVAISFSRGSSLDKVGILIISVLQVRKMKFRKAM